MKSGDSEWTVSNNGHFFLLLQVHNINDFFYFLAPDLILIPYFPKGPTFQKSTLSKFNISVL